MKEGIRNQLLISEYIYGIEWNRNADMRVLDAIAEYFRAVIRRVHDGRNLPYQTFYILIHTILICGMKSQE